MTSCDILWHPVTSTWWLDVGRLCCQWRESLGHPRPKSCSAVRFLRFLWSCDVTWAAQSRRRRTARVHGGRHGHHSCQHCHSLQLDHSSTDSSGSKRAKTASKASPFSTVWTSSLLTPDVMPRLSSCSCCQKNSPICAACEATGRDLVPNGLMDCQGNRIRKIDIVSKYRKSICWKCFKRPRCFNMDFLKADIEQDAKPLKQLRHTAVYCYTGIWADIVVLCCAMLCYVVFVFKLVF